jgi:hypothetical protein
MKATTIKVEGELLSELERVKSPTQSLSAFVRSVLQQDVLRRKMSDAAERYGQLLRENAEERSWLEEWEQADLSKPPRRRGR